MKTNEKYFKTIRVVAAILFLAGVVGLVVSVPGNWVAFTWALLTTGTAALLYACNDRHETDWHW